MSRTDGVRAMQVVDKGRLQHAPARAGNVIANIVCRWLRLSTHGRLGIKLKLADGLTLQCLRDHMTLQRLGTPPARLWDAAEGWTPGTWVGAPAKAALNHWVLQLQPLDLRVDRWIGDNEMRGGEGVELLVLKSETCGVCFFDSIDSIADDSDSAGIAAAEGDAGHEGRKQLELTAFAILQCVPLRAAKPERLASCRFTSCHLPARPSCLPTCLYAPTCSALAWTLVGDCLLGGRGGGCPFAAPASCRLGVGAGSAVAAVATRS